ncbi:hypothetical protein [uncultured Kingella sp.]|nr:hypothetical protein [uncultured Kingella sp.]
MVTSFGMGSDCLNYYPLTYSSLKKQRIVPCLPDKGECTAWF